MVNCQYHERLYRGAFTGIKAAVCGLILVTVVRLGRQILSGPFQWILAVASLAAIGVLGVNAVWVVIAGGIAGIIYNSVRRGSDKEEDE